MLTDKFFLKWCLAIWTIIGLCILLSCNGESTIMDLSVQQPGALGGAFIVAPSSGVSTRPNNLGLAQEVAIFQLVNKEQAAEPEVVTVAFGAFANTSAVGAGPIVGILNFGAGSGQNQRIEFDVPILSPNLQVGVGNGSVIGGWAVLSVPASTVWAGARNDGNLLPPLGSQTIGAGSLGVTVPAVTVAAHLGLGNTNKQAITRTVWIANDPTGATGLAAGTTGFAVVPAFARSFRVIRTPTSGTVNIRIQGTGQLNVIDGPYPLPPTAPSPTFGLGGSAIAVLIDNQAAQPTIGSLAVVFDLAI